MTTDRGVSTTVGYVIALGITTVLISGLLVATGGVVDGQQERTTRNALDVLGQRIASNLQAADRLAESDAATVAVEIRLPTRIAGSGYTVTVNGSGSEVVLESDRVDATARVQFVATTPVADADLRGGNLRVVLTPAGELEVRSA